MGIYTNGNIFGIRIYTFKEDICETLFEKKYHLIMSYEEKKEAYLFYTKLDNKENIFFKIYTECSDTYGKNSYMTWDSMSLELFLNNFDIY